MTHAELEFLIAQYADGTLPAERRGEVEAALAADAAARTMLSGYQKIDAALRRKATPAVNWEWLGNCLSQAVGGWSAVASLDGLEETVAAYAAGMLADSELPAFEARLESDASIRLAVSEYLQVDRLLRSELPPTPQVEWEKLADSISHAVAQLDAAQTPEDVEFAIANYVDGALQGEPAAEIETLFARDSAARVLLGEYENLGAVLSAHASADPIPSLDWDRLGGLISATVEREAAQAEERAAPSSYPIFGRFGRAAGAVFRSRTRVAIAASLLLASALGLRLAMHTAQPVIPKPVEVVVTTPAPAISVVAGPLEETASAASISEIQIGPPAGEVAVSNGFTDDISSRPASTIVASDAPRRYDSPGFPY